MRLLRKGQVEIQGGRDSATETTVDAATIIRKFYDSQRTNSFATRLKYPGSFLTDRVILNGDYGTRLRAKLATRQRCCRVGQTLFTDNVVINKF